MRAVRTTAMCSTDGCRWHSGWDAHGGRVSDTPCDRRGGRMLSFGIHFATCHGTALVRAGPSTDQSHRCQAYRPAALRLYCVTLCNNDDCNINTPSTVPPPLHTAPCHTHMATHAWPHAHTTVSYIHTHTAPPTHALHSSNVPSSMAPNPISTPAISQPATPWLRPHRPACAHPLTAPP